MAGMMLAMHMANELLTPGVAIGLLVLAGAGLAFSSWRTRLAVDDAKAPLMGVMGAFVFAAQMINFPILPMTSGHLGGGVLLAILLGPHAATLVMASILIVQCLIFQDGGLLALGANIINLGFIPCYLGYFLFRIVGGKTPGTNRLYLAVLCATMVGMLAGAAMVPVEVWASGTLQVPLPKFLAVMVGLHVLVALGETLITFCVLAYLHRIRPALVVPKAAVDEQPLSAAPVLASVLIAALVLGGVVSLYASEWPDALESITDSESLNVRTADSTLIANVNTLQEQTAPLPDYQFTSFSGVIGTLLSLAIIWGAARLLQRRPARVHEHVHPSP